MAAPCRLTVARFLTPKGTSINGVGIATDIAAPMTAVERFNVHRRAWLNEHGKEVTAPYKQAVDTQLERAVEALTRGACSQGYKPLRTSDRFRSQTRANVILRAKSGCIDCVRFYAPTSSASFGRVALATSKLAFVDVVFRNNMRPRQTTTSTKRNQATSRT